QSSTATTPSDIATSENGADKKKTISANIRSCMPLTIAQIKNRVCLIGIIRSIMTQETCITYTIEDGTGSIEIRQWFGIANQVESNIKHDVMLDPKVHPRDIYVKIYGRLQSFYDRISCVSHAIIPITNANEISFHFLNIIYTHLVLEKKPSWCSNNNPLPSFTTHTISRNNINSIVKHAIKVCGDEELGSHISSVISHLKDMFNEIEVLKSLDELAEDGQIYSLTEEYIQLVNF
ncbi:hypothetical protein INT46_007586, partial [Mucor plumbeus]